MNRKNTLFGITLLGAGIISLASFNTANLEMAPLRSNGAGFNGLGDRTGSPLSSATCNECHNNSGTFSPSVAISLTDGSGNAVTEYTPGQSYNLKYTVSAQGASNFGFQGVALDGSNAGAGSLGTPTSADTRVIGIGGIDYAEQSGTASGSGSFDFEIPWTAPASGAGDVTFYGIGLAANGSGTAGDDVSASENMTITEASGASIAHHSFRNSIELYPNPAKENLFIEIANNNEEITVSIADLSGKVFSKENHGIINNLKIDMPENEGIYLVTVSSLSGQEAVFKIVKE